jgi:hypothetical protein
MLQQLQLSHGSLGATDADSPAPLPALAAAAAAGGGGGGRPRSGGSSGSEFRSPMSSVGGGHQGGGATGQSQSWSETLRELGISVSQDLASPGSEAGGLGAINE